MAGEGVEEAEAAVEVAEPQAGVVALGAEVGAEVVELQVVGVAGEEVPEEGVVAVVELPPGAGQPAEPWFEPVESLCASAA